MERLGSSGVLGALYAALTWDPLDFSDAKKQRFLVNVLSGGKCNIRRCVEISLAVLCAVHRAAIPAALLHEQVRVLGRLINVSAAFRKEVQIHFDLRSSVDVAPSGSFFAWFQRALKEHGWQWITWNEIRGQ